MFVHYLDAACNRNCNSIFVYCDSTANKKRTCCNSCSMCAYIAQSYALFLSIGRALFFLCFLSLFSLFSQTCGKNALHTTIINKRVCVRERETGQCITSIMPTTMNNIEFFLLRNVCHTLK